MAAKSQSRLSGKSSKSGGSSASVSAKGDGKGRGKKVTMEDDEGDEKGALAYKILTQEQTNELLPLEVVQMQQKLMEFFSLENHHIDLTQASILDYYTSAVYWAVQQKFNAQQVSGFFTVVHTLLENVREKQMNMVDNMMELKKMLAGIGVDDLRSGGLDFFSVDQAKAITSYMQNCLFQHYRLYLYLFSHSQAEEIIGTDLDIEVAKAADVPFPPPLDEGVQEDVFRDYIATPPPTPSPEPEEQKPDAAQELERQVSRSDLFAQLTPEDIREVVESVTKEMLSGLQSEIAVKLRDKEGQILQRINKIHKVAD